MYSSILGSGEEAADHAHEILAQLSCHGHLAMLAAGVRPDPHPTDVRLCIRRDGAAKRFRFDPSAVAAVAAPRKSERQPVSR